MSSGQGIIGSEYWKSVETRQLEYAAPFTREWAIDAIRPSLFRAKCPPKTSVEQLKTTAYLDGLRGFAALLVYVGHHELWAHDAIGEPETIFENSYGYKGKHYFVMLPFVRILFSGGHYAVAIFFVISGYVLSTKPMQIIHIRDQAGLADNIASALFRRWFRLYLPVACITFLYMLCIHLGFRTELEPQLTFGQELWKWYKEFRDYSFTFDASGKVGMSYSLHIWSIPTEMKGSLVVYTSLISFSRCSRNARLCSTSMLLLYFIYMVDAWYLAMFTMGMLQGDLAMLATHNALPTPLVKLTKTKQPIFWLLLIAGIYLGGSPAASQDVNDLRDTPGWYYLSFLKPEAVYDYKWFYLFCAASLTTLSIPRLPIIKGFFENKFNQYLGRISYAFYLIHGPVMWLVADRFYAATGCTRAAHAITASRWMNIMPLPRGGPFGLELNFVLPHLLIFPITLWLAELATRLFDEPSVRFAQWLYQRVLSPCGPL